MSGTPPSVLTLTRTSPTPVPALRPFSPGYGPRLTALLICLAAVESDSVAGRHALLRHGWTGQLEEAWNKFHGWFVAVTLAGAIRLTVYSLIVYLYRYRAVLKGGG